MLANQTDRVYCDVEDLQYAITNLLKAADEKEKAATATMSLNDSIRALNDECVYVGAAIALQVITTKRIKDVNEFMLMFNRIAFEQYSTLLERN